MRVATSTSLQSVFGYGSAALAEPVTPIEATRQVRRGSSWSLEDQAFGAAIIREMRREPKPVLYGADARLKQFGSGDSGSEIGADTGDRALLEKLRDRDALVRGHENSHILAAGGQVSGPVQYTYQTGPDGRQYAIGGSVNISVVSSPANDEDAARQAETARRAATAGGEMSLRDMQVAMRATEISARHRSRALDAYSAS
jgi:hypothetical protein